MSFILANVRKEGTREQGAGGKYVNFVRSAPSRVYWFLLDNLVTFTSLLYFAHFNLILYLLFSDELASSITTSNNDDDPWHKSFVRFSEIPFSFPDISIKFDKGTPKDALQTLIELGAEEVKIPGSRTTSWNIHKPDISVVGEISELPPSSTHKLPSGAVSSSSIETVMGIALAVYKVGVTMLVIRNSIRKTPFDSAANQVKLELMDTHVRVPNASGDVDEEMEEGQTKEDVVSGTAEPFSPLASTLQCSFIGGDRAKMPELFLIPGQNSIPCVQGLLVPYDHTFSAPDPAAMANFIQTYKYAFFESEEASAKEIDNAVAVWVDELSNCDFGYYIAHMITCLKIAAEANTCCNFLVREDGIYLGGLIHGQLSIKVVGSKTISSLSGQDLTDAIGKFGGHYTALESIAGVLGIDTEDLKSGVMSMRMLRLAVFAKGTPSGRDKNTISKLLPEIKFKDDKPSGVNATTIIETITLLTNDEPIPDHFFLNAECFWYEDRTSLILARFGDTCPSFSYGGPTRIRCVPTAAKGVPESIIYTVTPPKFLQCKKITIGTATTQWNLMLTQGTLNTHPDSVCAGARRFQDDEALKIWQALGSSLEKTITRKNISAPLTAGESSSAGKGKRKAVEDGAPQKVKKNKCTVIFLDHLCEKELISVIVL